eukprot:439469_1
MSSEISEIEKCKDEIYQLSFVLIKFITALHSTVMNEMERQNTEMQNLISNYETTIDKWNEISQITKKSDMFEDALKNLNSYLKTTQEIFSKEMKGKEIPSIKITKQDPKKALNCLIIGFISQEIENKYNLLIPFYLKMICLQFYGNIIMNSNILNINQINT